MLKEHLTAVIAGAHLHTLDDLSRDVWKAHSAGMLDDEAAQRLAEAIQAKRDAVRAKAGGKPLAGTPAVARPNSYFPPKRRQTSPDRVRSLERRRTLAASYGMPPALAAQFTVGEQATLRIIADEVRANGQCAKTLGEIAARAGVGLSTARNALREAARLGLVTLEERRVYRAKNLPNVVRIVSREWLTWLQHGRAIGFKNANPTDNSYLDSKKKTAWNRQNDSKRRFPPDDKRSLSEGSVASDRPVPVN